MRPDFREKAPGVAAEFRLCAVCAVSRIAPPSRTFKSLGRTLLVLDMVDRFPTTVQYGTMWSEGLWCLCGNAQDRSVSQEAKDNL